MPIGNELTVRWGGVEYRQGQLTAADMIVMEEEWAQPFLEIDFTTMKAICWLVWLIRRHEESDLSLDDVTAITIDALADDVKAAQENPDPPTSAPSGRKRKSGGSGARTTAKSSASARGK